MVASELQTICRRIAERCEYGKLTPEEAIRLIDHEIGGITRTYYDGMSFTLKGQEEYPTVCLDTRGQGKKAVKRRERLAALGYTRAQENGSLKPGELHISSEASSKHHKAGLAGILG